MNGTDKVEGKTWQVLAKKCEDIGYGEWLIRLKIHKGKCVGFKQIEAPQIEYKEYQE